MDPYKYLKIRFNPDGSLSRYGEAPLLPVAPAGEPVAVAAEDEQQAERHIVVHSNDVPLNDATGTALRLFVPSPKSGQQLPLVVYFHGGGYVLFRAASEPFHNTCAALAAAAPAAVASVDYRLAPEHRLPAAIDAGHDALLWLRDIACGYKAVGAECSAAVERLRETADFSRVFLIGDSSGGNLVHLVAARAGEEEGAGALHPLRLAGGVLLHPGFAREKKSRSELENPPSLFLNEEMVDKLLLLGVPLGENKDSIYTNPELAANAVAHVAMPPLLLMVAEKDLLHDPQVDYGKAMVLIGKEVETKVSRGAVAHIFYLNFFAVKSDHLTAKRTKELIHTIKNFINHY